MIFDLKKKKFFEKNKIFETFFSKDLVLFLNRKKKCISKCEFLFERKFTLRKANIYSKE